MENEGIRHELEKSRAQLLMLYEIGNAMRTTLKLNEILYIILTAVTAKEGLGFNRAILFLVNEKEKIIEGKMGIGPESGEEAHKIWKNLSSENKTLDDLITSFHVSDKIDTGLNKLVRDIRLPLSEEGGIVSLTILEDMPFNVTKELSIKSPLYHLPQSLKAESFVTIPLRAKDKAVGALFADNPYTQEPITKDDIRILLMFANQAGLAIENSQLYEYTLTLSHSDSLTGLWNHGYFQQLLGKEIERSKELSIPLSLAMIDIDTFKNYNDKLGHQAGDALLKEISNIFRTNSRKNDILARYGGEEFTIIMPGTPKKEALMLCDRIRYAVEEHKFKGGEIQPNNKVTISVGIASYPSDAESKEDLIFHADMALYEAKSTGKNKVCLYGTLL